MKNAPSEKFYTKKEEIINAVTHGIGATLSLAALVILIVMAALRGDAWHVVSLAIFGSTLVLLYMMSTIYHSLRPGRAKRFFRTMDHVSIYLLIAGSYTPILITSMRNPVGWTIFGLIWFLAATGILLKIFFAGRFSKLSFGLYLAMGWLVVLALKPVINAISLQTLIFLAAGGVTYTLGAVFYACDRLPFNHAIWHVFVIGGSACHFFAFALGVIPG